MHIAPHLECRDPDALCIIRLIPLEQLTGLIANRHIAPAKVRFRPLSLVGRSPVLSGYKTFVLVRWCMFAQARLCSVLSTNVPLEVFVEKTRSCGVGSHSDLPLPLLYKQRLFQMRKTRSHSVAVCSARALVLLLVRFVMRLHLSGRDFRANKERRVRDGDGGLNLNSSCGF